jgi:diacylglycerol kinase family enzyme
VRYSVLFNPIAGRGQAGSVAESVQRQLEGGGHRVELQASERAGHIAELAEGASADRVLVLGGDGSLREAAGGLLRRGGDLPELGILPFGTGNVVARELGLPLDPLAAAVTMEASEAVAFDVGWAQCDDAEPQAFLAMLGIGYDAAVAGRIGRSRATALGGAVYKRSAGVLYGAAGLRELFALKVPRFQVTTGDQSIMVSAAAAVLSNTETYGKGMAMSPGANAADGLFHLHLRSSAAPWTGAAALVAAQFRRSAPGWAVSQSTGNAFEFAALDRAVPMLWQLDGDPLGPVRRIVATMQPRALRLIGALP